MILSRHIRLLNEIHYSLQRQRATVAVTKLLHTLTTFPVGAGHEIKYFLFEFESGNKCSGINGTRSAAPAIKKTAAMTKSKTESAKTKKMHEAIKSLRM